jgi:cbb3-type cytochrome oxidase maturation protein
MSGLLYLIPIALFLGGVGLAAFLWALKSGQFEDPEGAAARILLDDDLETDESPQSERMSR